MAFEDGSGSGGSIGVRGRGGERLSRARHGRSASRRESSLHWRLTDDNSKSPQNGTLKSTSQHQHHAQPHPTHGTDARGATSKESGRLQ
jgi:hypothetical protein